MVPPQALAIESCQNLMMYKKTKTLLLKPEEVPKKTKIFMSRRPPSPKIGKLLFFCVFLVPVQVLAKSFWFFGTSSGFGNKIAPKPEEVPKTTISINIPVDTTPFQLPDSGCGFQGSA